MEKIALISDLHSNKEALEAVLKDIDKQGAKKIYCLGDIIGYGPNPREIINYCTTFEFTLMGNHEEGLLFTPILFHHEAKTALDWTRDQLNSDRYEKKDNFKLWDFLDNLPETMEEQNGDVLFVHATPRSLKYEYIRPPDVNDVVKMMNIFDHIKRLCFYGHTHEPGVFTDDMKFFAPEALDDGRMELKENKKYFINVGSVGQPRDGSTKSCYIIFDGTSIQFRRVEYDFKATMDKILRTKVIPQRFATRLREGK